MKDKKIWIRLIPLVVLSVIGIVIAVALLAPKESINGILESYSYSWTATVRELDKVLLKDGLLTEKERVLIDDALDSADPGSESALRLALYTVVRTEYGYPAETARWNLSNQISAIDPTYYYRDALIATILEKAPWSLEQLYEKYSAIHDSTSYSYEEGIRLIAESSRHLPLSQRLQWAAAIKSPSFSSVDFLSASLTRDDLPELGVLLTDLTDPEQRSLCASAMAAQSNQPEDIVPLLYRLRQEGFSLEELFPQGILLDMDLSALNQLHDLPDAVTPLPADCQFLIVSRTEHDVKAEQLSQVPPEGYSSHRRADPASFDVRLETAWMDRMNPDQLPASYAECQWLAVVDIQFVYGGCIDKLQDYGTRTTQTGLYFYPVYSCLQRLILVEPDSLLPQYHISTLSLDANTDQTVTQWTNTAVGTSVTFYAHAPRMDSTWKDDALRQFLGVE